MASQTSRGSADTGALYVHVQSESGVEHRTIVLSRRTARLLRFLWSRWGTTLALVVAASWVYFATAAVRVPLLKRQITELELEARRIDTLEATLQSLQGQYDQVQRMLGVPRPDSGTAPSGAPPPPRQP